MPICGFKIIEEDGTEKVIFDSSDHEGFGKWPNECGTITVYSTNVTLEFRVYYPPAYYVGWELREYGVGYSRIVADKYGIPRYPELKTFRIPLSINPSAIAYSFSSSIYDIDAGYVLDDEVCFKFIITQPLPPEPPQIVRETLLKLPDKEVYNIGETVSVTYSVNLDKPATFKITLTADRDIIAEKVVENDVYGSVNAVLELLRPRSIEVCGKTEILEW